MMPSVASRLKKNFSRTKEKILQGMGKTDRTNDNHFDVYVENFDTQNLQASKLTKELNKYLSCLKETQKASKAFYDTLKDTYEEQWPGSDSFSQQVDSMENKWHDYISRLSDDVQYPLIAYLNEFPELKKKIDKRGNRLLDFDDARHSLENLQNRSTKKVNSSVTAAAVENGGSSSSTSTTSSSAAAVTQDQLTKLTKLKIDLEDKQNIYEEINQTLCMGLPVLYENRIKFYSSLFQTFFHTETMFHSECTEIKSKLDDICENLSTTSVIQRQQSQETNKAVPEASMTNDETVTVKKSEFIPSNLEQEDQDDNNCENKELSDSGDSDDLNLHYPKICELEIKNPDISLLNLQKTSHELVNPNLAANNNSSSGETDLLEQLKCLYTVKATYAYDSKEIDELTFVKDDVIEVVDGTLSEKEELDDGWLIGIHLVTQKRGLFPENFTKKI
jgi:amphiphysin